MSESDIERLIDTCFDEFITKLLIESCIDSRFKQLEEQFFHGKAELVHKLYKLLKEVK